MAWVGIAGWGGMPRPVATLTLSGLTTGLFINLLQCPVLLVGDRDVPSMLVGSVAIPVIQTLWGFLAGLLALAVQRLRQVRR